MDVRIRHAEETASRMQFMLQQREQQQQILTHRLEDQEHRLATQETEQRDMMMKHAEETASLRKRIQVLTEQLDAGPAPLMSAQSSSAGFNDFTVDMEDALNISTHDWDNFDFFNDLNGNAADDFSFEPKPDTTSSPAIEKRQSPANTVITAEQKPAADVDQPPVASGLLFFLLLCGAFVASRPAGSRPSYIPQVPEDVQAAAPALIQNLLSDSGSFSTIQDTRTHHIGEPGPSSLPRATRSHGRLDQIHHRITSPSKEQEAAAAFSLTTHQYASISGMDYLGHNGRSSNQDRRISPSSSRPNLAETLANIEAERASNKAEVYTRSLLWERIPADVLRQFRELANDRHESETRPGSQMLLDDDDDDLFDFKIEK